MHHPAAPHVGALGLELGLHERQHVGAGAQRAEHGGQHEGQRYEGHVDHRKVGGRVEGLERARVRALAHLDARVVAQLLRELPVARVDGHDLARAALEQAVGESAGRRADVEAAQPAHVDAGAVEGVRELLAAAAHERRRLAHLDGRTLGDRLRGPRRDRAIDAHVARHHERAGALTRGREATLDECNVEARARARASGWGGGHVNRG